MTKAICDMMETEKVQDSIHEGFEPAVCCEDILLKASKQAMDEILKNPDETNFVAFSTPLKLILQNTLGETIEELEDGFKNGQDDVWKWIHYNRSNHNAAQVPPSMAMMADMKSQQQVNVLKGMFQKYGEGKRQGNGDGDSEMKDEEEVKQPEAVQVDP